ncbi:hypothetical protein EIP91_002113 [Steccherinum ochraceum]|uniref:F-box domain-containing protein n=1 Tax=Steccherinum ochraceum TaxID=92696 RepID=A0A4V2MXN0_9APHY|nr:hypothetical protein EIP91_002113 [Steccherinum ochraceum]
MLPFLAPELRLNITRFVDRPTLPALCLASLDWLSPAQAKLFQDLYVHLHDRSAQDAIHFLESHSHLRISVTHLYIFGDPWSTYSRLDKENLFVLLGLLPVICNVTLDRVQIARSPSIIGDPVPQGAHLKLVLSRSLMDKTMLDILLTRLRVTELHLPSLRLEASDGPLLPLFRPEMFKSIRRLNIGRVNTYLAPRTEWRTSDILAVCSDVLKSLGVGYDLYEYVYGEVLYRFLQEKGRHIESLTIDYGSSTKIDYETRILPLLFDEDGGGMPPEWPDIILSSCCPSLTHITLVLSVVNGSSDYMKNHAAVFLWQYAMRLLATAPKTLRSIILLLYMDGYFSPQDRVGNTIVRVDWKNWDEMLKGFDMLEGLTFVAVKDETFGEEYFEMYQKQSEVSSEWLQLASEFVFEKLPSLYGRDVLRFM